MTFVPPEGDPATALIAVVGARPGDEEAAMKRPFIGPSGRILEQALSYAGLSREQCYITNVVKTYDPLHPLPGMMETVQARDALIKELNATNARIVLCLGSTALFAVMEQESIEEWRGAFLTHEDLPGKRIFATYHPAAVAREQTFWWIFNRDIKRLVKPHNPPVRNLLLNPTRGEVDSFLDSIKEDEISVDVETMRGHVDCIGIAPSASRAICIPLVYGRLGVEDLVAIFRRLAALFKTKSIIGQNIQFDVSQLRAYGFHLPNIGFDTMLAHHLLWPELPHDLGFLVSWYTDEGIYKHTIRSERWKYNATDASATFEVKEKLEGELKKKGLLDYYHKYVIPLLKPLRSMQETGLLVDGTKLAHTDQRLGLEEEYLQEQLNLFSRRPINVRSTTDLQWLLHTHLSIPRGKTTKGGKPATDEATLIQYSYNSPNADIFKLILAIRERRTLRASFLQMDTDSEGRYHAAYKLHGTETGRLSSVALTKGPQLQNIPRVARKVFVPADGCCLLEADLKRAEAMFVAYDSGEQGLIDIFNDPTRDLYWETAKESLGYTPPAKGWERELFKKVTHACDYDMGDFVFVRSLRQAGIYAEDLPVPEMDFDTWARSFEGSEYEDDSKRKNSWKRKSKGERKCCYLRYRFFSRYPKVREWQYKIAEMVKATRSITDAFGRTRTFLGRMDKHLIKSALATRPQSSVVSVTNQALVVLESKGAPLLAQTHDSILLEPKLEELEHWKTELVKAMSIPIPAWGGTFTIPVELKMSKVSWGEMDELPG